MNPPPTQASRLATLAGLQPPTALERPAVVRVLWGIVATCLVAGIVAIPVTGDDEERIEAAGDQTSEGAEGADGVDGADGTTTPAPGVTAPAGGEAPASPAGTSPAGAGAGAGSGSTTTAAPLAPPEDLGPATDPGPTKAPRPGVYRYRAQSGGSENEATTTVEDKGTTDAGRNQVLSQRGGGIDSSSDAVWRNDGLILLRSSFSFGQTTGECDWDPDFLQLELPLAKGAAWQTKSSCMVTGFGPTPLLLERTLDAKVVDLRRVRVAGTAVDVWVLESTDHIEIAGRVMRQSGTTSFSPRHGIVVSSSGTATTDGRATDYATEVKNLDPE